MEGLLVIDLSSLERPIVQDLSRRLRPAGTTIQLMSLEEVALPPELLQAIAQRTGRVALVVGAGCSLEHPTGLKGARELALDVHRRLLLDGVLNEGECEAPDDLSVLATTVWRKHGSQLAMVERLPRRDFRIARPNTGYFIAAALLRERAVNAVLTLNFDLAMSTALVLLSATEVDVVPGPTSADQLGAIAVIYLHRNVDEADPERWILRVEALQEDWRDNWEEVVSQRVMSSPIVVFAGLGSPAAVLTETVTRVRQSVDAQNHRVYVVDPALATQFEAALNVGQAAHIELGWCDFMERLAARVVAELEADLEAACRTLCDAHGWDDEVGHASALCRRLHEIGLVAVGKLRASWLLERQAYSPDDARRCLVADLLLAIGLVEREIKGQARFREDGVVQLLRDGTVVATFLAASGEGALRWAALEARVLEALGRMPMHERPTHAVLGGMQGSRPADVVVPEDVVIGDPGFDIAQGNPRPEFVTIEEIRSGGGAIARLVA